MRRFGVAGTAEEWVKAGGRVVSGVVCANEHV